MEIVAHRGFNGLYPEMTALAYEKALELPIQGVECDVRLTRDGELVCLHDRTLMRMAHHPTVISTSTVEELKALKIAGSDYPPLLLNELLDMVLEHPDKSIYIETKHPARYGRMLEEQVVKALRYRGLEASPRVNIISFSHASIRRIKKLAPHLHTFYLMRRWEEWGNKKLQLASHPYGVGLNIGWVRRDPGVIARIGRPTYVFTVNDPSDMALCEELGVEVLATDFPDKALNCLPR